MLPQVRHSLDWLMMSVGCRVVIRTMVPFRQAGIPVAYLPVAMKLQLELTTAQLIMEIRFGSGKSIVGLSRDELSTLMPQEVSTNQLDPTH